MLRLQRVWLNASIKITEVELGRSQQATTVTWGFLASLQQLTCCGVTVGCGHDEDLMTFALVSATSVPTNLNRITWPGIEANASVDPGGADAMLVVDETGIAHLFANLIIHPARDAWRRTAWSRWRRRHQHRAQAG
jgi:hypothetical protein